ncbi:hypothetical protein CCP4SC76_3750001 [Gammaproteobacteria bacterium]
MVSCRPRMSGQYDPASAWSWWGRARIPLTLNDMRVSMLRIMFQSSLGSQIGYSALKVAVTRFPVVIRTARNANPDAPELMSRHSAFGRLEANQVVSGILGVAPILRLPT